MGDEINPGKVFLGGLAYDSTEDSLRRHFEEKFGQVSDAHIVRDRNTMQSRGFGFVTFVDPAVAKAVQMCDHQIDGEPPASCQASFARPAVFRALVSAPHLLARASQVARSRRGQRLQRATVA